MVARPTDRIGDGRHAKPPADPDRATHPGDRPRIRVSAFIPSHGRVLLVCQRRRAERHSPPYWLLPGGGLRHGESLHEALARELAEELGAHLAGLIRVRCPIAIVESISPDPSYPKHVLHLIMSADWPIEACSGDRPPDLVPVADPALLEARFVPAAALDRLPLRPPLAVFLRRRLAAPSDAIEYLGRLW